ncbi:3-oxoacyl-(acyl-carrier protein) reductase [Oxalobacteraceae bacterium IMCC9480]|nr:3-oxoacyl-(acyl-carrier protein) reductase [Oxalobacteraceae bacterium IMCC9480]NDP60171.1 SDR family oxidoreductase [Oxalobacteraceae bacterium]
MKIDLAGKVALVTGSATGIGRAIAEALSASGARVALNHFGQGALMAEVLDSIGEGALAFDADVTDGAAVQRMVAAIEWQLGPIDILVNNAGILLEKPFLDIAEYEWDHVIAVDLKSVFLCSQAVLRNMQPRGRGCIINVASELAYLGRAEFTAYCAAKAGVVGLTKSLAREFAPAIRVNGIAPGPTDTAMLSLDQISPEWRVKELAIPAARAAGADEIAATAVFLASDFARFYYGQMLSPNGGALML